MFSLSLFLEFVRSFFLTLVLRYLCSPFVIWLRYVCMSLYRYVFIYVLCVPLFLAFCSSICMSFFIVVFR